MMEMKYTKDGRKVLVVGKLNSEQHIVQEIFVTNGQEVPSGESFVVSVLLDAPAESWKEKNLRQLEERYDKSRKNLERQTNEVNQRLRVAEEKAKHRTAALLAFAKNSDHEQLKTLHSFLSGEITHFFVDSSYSPEIVDWNSNKPYQTDSWAGRMKVEGMALISLFGNSNGQMNYRINKYRDGSGSNATIIPCRSYEHALAEAQAALNVIADDYVSNERRNFYKDAWLKIDGIVIPADALKKYNEKKRNSQIARIKKLRNDIETIEAEMASP